MIFPYRPRRHVADLLEQLGFCDPGVAHQHYVDVASDFHAITHLLPAAPNERQPVSNWVQSANGNVSPDKGGNSVQIRRKFQIYKRHHENSPKKFNFKYTRGIFIQMWLIYQFRNFLQIF